MGNKILPIVLIGLLSFEIASALEIVKFRERGACDGTSFAIDYAPGVRVKVDRMNAELFRRISNGDTAALFARLEFAENEGYDSLLKYERIGVLMGDVKALGAYSSDIVWAKDCAKDSVRYWQRRFLEKWPREFVDTTETCKCSEK